MPKKYMFRPWLNIDSTIDYANNDDSIQEDDTEEMMFVNPVVALDYLLEALEDAWKTNFTCYTCTKFLVWIRLLSIFGQMYVVIDLHYCPYGDLNQLIDWSQDVLRTTATDYYMK